MSSDDIVSSISTPMQFAGSKVEVTSEMHTTGPAVFKDAMTGSVVDMPDRLDDIANIDHIGQTDLDKFFARPIRIYHNDWASTGSAVLFPWSAYLTNTLVANKLSTFAYLRARLHIKFIVNSTPFNFGAMQAAYYPYCLDQSELNYGINSTTRTTKVPIGLRVYLQSTLPHVVLEASKSKGGEIIAPFIYDRNWLELSLSEGARDLGKISFQDLAPIDSANGNTPAATITVYAWLEDVKLTGSTNAAILQADAYGTGPISKPASVIANIASRLSSAPIIGKYATATQIAATAVGRVASMFGFSNIPLIAPIHNNRICGFGNFASSEIGSHIEKLTLDPKNELTIDPTTLGAPDDEMSISSIVQREGLVAIADWGTNYNVDSQLAATPVGTSYIVSGSGSGINARYLPPITHVSMPFGFWRGDIIFRFKIICSPYHKGRLRISWDTLTQPSRTANGYQNSLTTVWDLSDTDEMEFCVPYQNETAFLPVRNELSPGGWNVTPDAPVSDLPTSNGVLSVVVVNKLTAPIDNSFVKMLIYVRGAENMEFAAPVNILNSSDDTNIVSFIEPQSDVVELQSEVVSVAYKSDSRDDPNMYKVHFGEVVKSIKVLMYRTNRYYYGVFGNTNLVGYSSTLPLPRLPAYYGYDPNGLNLARNQANTANVPYNWVRTTPYHWFNCAYVFQRGGHNYRINFLDSQGSINVTRRPYPSVDGTTNNTWRTALTVVPSSRDQVVFSTHATSSGAGAAYSISEVNPSVEICSPFYSRYRAVSTNPAVVNQPPYSYNNGTTNVALTTAQESLRSAYNLECINATTFHKSNNLIHCEVYHSVGVDFSLAFYRGCPCLYVITLPAAAT